ncbi:MAG: hypothetical protein HN350_14930, partial [Phycisphaerales bacterium]|nr:hypothetical protein [Phycisphaerales bacterium]
HMALIKSDGGVYRINTQVPMPSFAKAAVRENSRPGCTKFGVFYERGELTTDSTGRPWIVYRHFYSPQTALAKGMRSHVESGWRIYARCIEGAKWSKLYAFDIPQRDGMQRLSITPTPEGLAAVWTTGRTDRRKDPLPRGIAFASLSHPKGEPANPVSEPMQKPAVVPPIILPPKTIPPKPATVAGKSYRLYYGDLHRHTDMSLCFPFLDGSLEDAYRYAIDVAGLDFLGVTDHTRDINHGNVKSQLWWRCTKQVTRHRLGKTFFPMFTYERSMNGTDHNVITLRDDVLRNFTYPLIDFWKELDHDSFTVPHAPVHIKTWLHKNDDMRPLIEIYQGCRDHDSQQHAHAGLDRGHHIGFIASSDHVSTSASYACVWAPENNLTSIFRSMQIRRTFGATDKIRLIFRSGDHWMGEKFIAKSIPEFQIEIDGTAPMKSLTIYDNGHAVSKIPLKEGQRKISTTYKPADKYFTGKHYIYIHMVQTDGNQAWSSPIWVTYENPVKDPNPKPKPKPTAKVSKGPAAPGKLGDLPNLARGKFITTNFPDGITAGRVEMVTDGKLGGYLGRGFGGSGWVQVDLGEVVELGNIRAWHYYRDGRTYKHNRLSVSATGKFAGEETVVFDAAKDGAYSESKDGKLFTFTPVNARYIRNSLGKNTANKSTQWMEIEAYGPNKKEQK